MTIESLRQFGADVDDGVTRCAGNEAFYLRMIDKIKADPGFDQLDAAVREGRLEDGFKAAHALKGVLGNLSLTPLYKPVEELTELLRAKKDMDYTPLLDEIRAKKEEFYSL